MYEVDQYTVSLLHFEDGIKDESGKVWTANGGATTSTVQSKFGGKSLFLNGVGQYLTAPSSSDFEFGSGDFTIDFWVYMTDVNWGDLFNRNYNATGYTPFKISIGNGVYAQSPASNGYSWDIAGGGADSKIMHTNWKLNQWVHYAVVRDGTKFYVFENGQQVCTWSSSLAIISSTSAIGIGFSNFLGYIDEFRISKGIARWTGNFTLPTEPVISIEPPTNLTATAGDSQVALSWDAVINATGYNVKRSTTAGGPYTTIAANVTGTSYVDTTVTNGTTYYYVVTAVNTDGESGNSNEASATPVAAPVEEGDALLRITLNDSSEREYKVSKAIAGDFVNWCNRTIGTGSSYYVFDKSVQNSKEYLFYEKIISFEVIDLA